MSDTQLSATPSEQENEVHLGGRVVLLGPLGSAEAKGLKNE